MSPLIQKMSVGSLKPNLRRGQVFEVAMRESDGITLKGGDSSRDKYTVIIGVDADFVYGCVLINSRINQNIAKTNPEFYDYQYPLLQFRYKEMLKDPSHVNCTRIFDIPASRFTHPSTKYIGQLSDEDMLYIIDLVKSSRMIPATKKKRFNLL